MTTKRAILALLIGTLIGFLWGMIGHYAFAHEHQAGESEEEARTIEFLRNWKRPRGPYNIGHRVSTCCYIGGMQQDCFPVKETRIEHGVTFVFPDTEGHIEYARWYQIPEGVAEDEQPDPRESPDGRSYVCVAGNNVICYVRGSGT